MTRFVAAYESRLLGADPELHVQRLGRRGELSSSATRPTSVARTPRSTTAKGEVDKAAKARCGSDAWNLPVVFGPIAVTYNLPGVDGLILDGPTAAKIFNGAITTWNDPAIAALNPGTTKLPAEKITVLYRNDESGTTDNFQKYLDAASDGAWGKGAGKTFNGGVGEGAKGNEGTSAAIKSTPGAITYNEWSFAKSQGLATPSIVTSAGPDPVAISTESVGKTIEGAKVKGTGNDLVLDTSSFYKPTADRRLPDRAGDLRDRLLEVRRRRHRYGGQGLPAVDDRRRARQGLADNGYIPIPDTFKSKLSHRDQRDLLTARGSYRPGPRPGVLVTRGGPGVRA